eukprot:404197_1
MTETGKKRPISDLIQISNDLNVEPAPKKAKQSAEWINILNDLIPPYYLTSKTEEIVKQKRIEQEYKHQQQLWIEQHNSHSIWKLFKDRSYRSTNKTKAFSLSYKNVFNLFNNNSFRNQLDLTYTSSPHEFELNNPDIEYQEDEIIQINVTKNDIYSPQETEELLTLHDYDIYDILNGMLLSDLKQIYIASNTNNEQFETLFNGNIQYGDVLQLKSVNSHKSNFRRFHPLDSPLYIVGYGDSPFYADKNDLKFIQAWNGGYLGENIPPLEFGDAPKKYFDDLRQHYVPGVLMDPLRMINKENSLYNQYMKQYYNSNGKQYDIILIHHEGGCNMWMKGQGPVVGLRKAYKYADIHNQSNKLHEEHWMVRYDAAINARKERIYQCCQNVMQCCQMVVIRLIVEFVL